MDVIILPGIGGSGEEHWQTHWERAQPAFRRFQPGRWDEPVLGDWMQALERAVAACAGPPVLVAHSLACLLVAHWAASTTLEVAGAFLVSVPDPDGAAFPGAAATFRTVPPGPLPFPSLIVASTNDLYGTLDYATDRACQWRSGLAVAGALGHINAASGLGSWAQGRTLLDAFVSCLPKLDGVPRSVSAHSGAGSS